MAAAVVGAEHAAGRKPFRIPKHHIPDFEIGC
jgi:hypothetical protein